MYMLHHSKLSALDLNLLVVLQALLEERHVTRAADRVGLSQSATSHALSRLRELYKDPLLVRSGRRLDPTPRAVELLPQLSRGLGELGATLSGARAFEPSTAQRSFSVGMADYAQALLVPPLLGALTARAPNIDISVSGYPNISERLDDGSLDLAVMPTSDLAKGLSSQPLFDDGFTCMVRKGHPEVKGARLTLARYLSLRHVLVSPSGQGSSYVDTELTRRNLTRRVALRVSSFLIAPQVVAESDLISTGPTRLLRSLSTRYPIRLYAPPLRLPRFALKLVWHSRLDHDPAHDWLRRQVTEVCHRF